MSAAGDLAPYWQVGARKLRQRRWRCVTGAADRRRRSRRGLPYLGSTRFYGGSTRWQGNLGRFTGLRLRCGDWRAAAGGCHGASLMIKRRAAAGAVRPCVRPDPGSPPSSFPQVTCLDRSGRPVLPPLFACEMRARPALAALVWGGDGSPVWGCITTLGDQVPPRDTFSNSSNLQQKRTAEDTIADVGASGLRPGKAVTEVTAAGSGWLTWPSSGGRCATTRCAAVLGCRGRCARPRSCSRAWTSGTNG